MDRRTSPNLHPETNAKNFFYVYVINLSSGVISYGFFHDLVQRVCFNTYRKDVNFLHGTHSK